MLFDERFTPTVVHDVDSESFYVRLSDAAVYQTRRITVNVLVDLDEDGGVLGVEVLELGAHVPYHVLITQYNMSDFNVENIKRLLSYKV